MLDQLDCGNYGPLSMKARSAAGMALTLSCGRLRHLIDTTAKPNFTIQVILSATASRTTPGYPVTLLRFRVHEVPTWLISNGSPAHFTPMNISRSAGTGWHWRRFSQPNRLPISAGCRAISDRTPM